MAQPCPRDGKRGCKNEKNGGFAIFFPVKSEYQNEFHP